MGETSDNLPGVPGVGPGFAARWIKQYGDLDGVITNADKITGKKGESLREHLTDVLRNRRLNALVRDLDLPLKPIDLKVQPWDRTEVHKVFDSLEFRVLRDRLFETLTSEEEIEGDGFDVGVTELAPGALGAWLAAHASAGERVGVHVRGVWRAGTGDVQGLALATADQAVWVDASDDLARGRRGARPRGWPTRRSPRSSTTPRARCSPWPPAAGRCSASTATPRCRRTSRGPTSAPTTWPT